MSACEIVATKTGTELVEHFANMEMKALEQVREAAEGLTDCCGFECTRTQPVDKSHFCVICLASCCTMCKKKNANGSEFDNPVVWVICSSCYDPNNHEPSTATSASASNDDGSGAEEDDGVVESAAAADGSDCAAKAFFVQKENNVKVLMAMAIGLTDCVQHDDNVFARNKSLSSLKPSNDQLVGEILRRRRENGEPNPKINSQKRRKDYIDWLNKNPITDEDDIKFVKAGAKALQDAALKKLSAKSRRGASAGGGNSGPAPRCTGPAPFMRIIHCIGDDDDIKLAFLCSFDCLTREELCGRNNPASAREDVWQLVADKYNSKDFNPESILYPQAHEALAQLVDISFAATVERMGQMTPEKAKAKFMEMKGHASVVQSKFEQSGSGDGSRDPGQADHVAEDGGGLQIGANYELGAYLGEFGPHVLYMMLYANDNGLTAACIQRITASARLDGSSIPSVRDNRKSRRSDSQDAESAREYKRQMTESNQQMGQLNITMASAAVQRLDKEIRDSRREIARMRRANDRAGAETEQQLLNDVIAERKALANRVAMLEQRHVAVFESELLELDGDEGERTGGRQSGGGQRRGGRPRGESEESDRDQDAIWEEYDRERGRSHPSNGGPPQE